MPSLTDRSRKLSPLRSMREFAEALQTKIPTLQGWIKHSEWKWNKRAPWAPDIVPDVLRWKAESLSSGRPPGSSDQKTAGLRREKLLQEIRKLRANADQAETALSRERGSLHDADQCEEEAVRRAALYRNAVQNVPMQVVSLALSSGLPHEAAPMFQKQIEELVNGCLRYTAAAADARPEEGDDSSLAGAAAAGAMDAVTVG